jgi:NADH-quinone oxidoreductase subunit M
MLTAIIVLPFLAALVMLAIPRNYRFLARIIALLATFATLVLAATLFLRFGSAPVDEAGYRFVQRLAWVDPLGINYLVGVDGLNVGLILMGALVAFGAACVSWEIQSSEKEYYILLMVMTGGILGAFASLDLFFFYAFHEFALVPTFIMIGVWGRGRERNHATFNITMYLTAGALIALFGLIALYLQMPPGQRTSSIPEMTRHFAANPMAAGAQGFIFPLLLFGFGILVSLWPFHTWAPLGYGAAPTATAMLHAGVLKKFGLYGLIRVALPLLPQAAQSWAGVIAWLCLGNILYCGWVAMRQRDLNQLIGNSSVAHMGFAFLGLASLNLIGVTGAVLVMIAHGLLAALTFGLSGYLRHAAGTLEMESLGGLLRKLPFVGTAMIMAMLAGCGLPGFANFTGEVSVLFGAWQSGLGHPPRFVAVAAWGALVVGAIYMLRAVRHIWHGPMVDLAAPLTDANAWRRLPFVLLLGALIGFGVFPGVLANRIKASVEPIIKMATTRPGPDPAADRKPVTAALDGAGRGTSEAIGLR